MRSGQPHIGGITIFSFEKFYEKLASKRGPLGGKDTDSLVFLYHAAFHREK